MAIDKTIPNKLQADLDQRYVRPEAGEMIDAQNVIVTESGANTDGVMQNMYGTIAATPPELNALPQDNVTVIGSVSDSQRGFIYFFVADNDGSTQHAIYRLDTSDNSYELVLKASGLNFDPNGFVKADIVNAAFQQDGVIQTALYFTDNRNPPRKINVDRAISSAVYDATQSTFDTVISACKPAMQRYPTVSFATDQSFEQNNFKTSAFQFAVQQIYIDGEESAISGYSELAVSNHAIFGAQEGEGYGIANHIDNVCEVVIPVDFQKPDLEKIRIIARDGNNGAFFVVDEFNPDVDLYKDFFGEQKQIYDASARRYRFYNNVLGRAVSTDTVSKSYDNVPLIAAGQSVSGNRLMFSNYEEGRANTPINASLSVNNKTIYDKESNYIAPGSFSSHVSIGTGLSIDVDALAAASSWSALESPATTNTVVPAGASITLGFDFSSEFILDGIGIQVEVDGDTWDKLLTGGGSTVRLFGPKPIGHTGGAQSVGDLIPHVFNITLLLEEDTTIGQVMSEIQSRLSSYTARVKYGMAAWDGSLFSAIRLYNEDLDYLDLRAGSNGQYVEVDWGFDDYAAGGTSTAFTMQPYIKGIRLVSGNLSSLNGGLPYRSFESLDIVNQDVLDEDGQAQSEVAYSGYSANFITSPVFSASNESYKSGFKAGSSHTFGVVYYDKFNRSGNVNEIGTVYVDDISTRSSNYGPASVTIDLSATTPPDWATSYQIVYPGPDSIQDFVGYTSGGAYYKRELSGNGSNDPDIHTQEIYVSLNSLKIYNEEKKTERSYSFTKGDKLRLVSRYDHAAATPGRVYDKASDGTAIEFDVVGVVTIGSDNDILAHKHGGSASTIIDSNDYGDFLILESSAVNGGAVGKNGNALKFNGYDWFSVTGENHPDGTAPSTSSRWGQGTVVEIYSPRKTTSERVFFEIGEGGVISNGGHGDPIEVTNGNVFFRPVACKTSPDATEANIYDEFNYEYRTFYLECDSASDRVQGTSWHKGRPHVVFENAATVRRQNGITYSDAYEEDVANLSLSSFNASLANFFSLEASNGACNYIGSFREDFLVALQENKMAMVPIKKSILSTASSGELLGLNTDVLNSPQYYVGDYGCGDNPESVLIQDNQVFFADLSRRKILRWTGEGISPISDNGVASLLATNLDNYTANGGTRIVSGYDPRFDQYFVTLPIQGNFDGFTLGYNVPTLSWQSRYTFFPTNYASQNDMMYSCLYSQAVEVDGQNNLFFSHDHNGDNVDGEGAAIPGGRNRFYRNVAQDSEVTIVSNYNPSMVKVFNALSIETDSNWTVDEVVTDLGSVSRTFALTEKEGALYGAMGGDESVNSSMHIIPLGRIASFTTNTVTFTKRVNTLPLMVGATVMRMNSGTLEQIGVNDAIIAFNGLQNSTTINLSGQPVISEDEDLVLVTLQSQNGDPIRGHWAEVTISNNQATPFELFCVNTHFADSKQNHALGQQ